MPKVERKGDFVKFDCPGCGRTKMIPFQGESLVQWQWNGDCDKPTVTPSILSTWTEGEEHVRVCCHSNMTNGQLQFHGDCTHALRSQTVEMAEVT